MASTFLHTTTLAPNEFTANGSTWRVTMDGSFIVLLRDGASGEYIGHCGPAKQWVKEVQQAAAEHLAALNK